MCINQWIGRQAQREQDICLAQACFSLVTRSRDDNMDYLLMLITFHAPHTNAQLYAYTICVTVSVVKGQNRQQRLAFSRENILTNADNLRQN